MRPGLLLFGLWLGVASPPLQGQASGDISGRVRESWGRHVGIEGARVTLDSTTIVAVTDFKGRYRFHAVPPGVHSVRVEAVGYAPVGANAVPVFEALSTSQDLLLASAASGSSPPTPPSVIDPFLLDDRQRLTADEIRDLPISTTSAAVELLNGVAAGSYHGGRPGEQVAVVGGVPLRNAYDASTATLGIDLPLGLVQDVGLASDVQDLSAEGALSGVLAVSPRRGGDHWTGTARYEGDRLFAGSADQGYDRLNLEVSGPVANKIRVAGALDGVGELQFEPHGAPTGSPLAPLPWALPHNSGDQINGALTVTAPFGAEGSVQLLAARSLQQFELFEPTYKYAEGPEPGRQVTGTLVSATLHRVTSAKLGEFASLSYFVRDFEQGELAALPSRGLGALTLSGYRFAGDALARGLDTATANAPLPGYADALLVTQTPWGVPEYLQGNDPRGDLLWNHTREVRADLGLDYLMSDNATLRTEAGVTLTRATAFQRTLAFFPVGDSVPPATATDLSPIAFHVGGRMQLTLGLGVLNLGARIDGMAPGAPVAGGLRLGVSPAVSLLVPMGGLTLDLALAQESQFPDLQFLAAQAFDDSLANGHFRAAGDVGYEISREFAVGLRTRASGGSVHVGVFGRVLSNLVASDSALGSTAPRFENSGSGRAFGVDIEVERPIGRQVGLRVGYSYESTSYDAGTAYRAAGGSATPLDQDRPHHLVAMVHAALPAGVRGGAVFQYASGFPYTNLGSPAFNGQRAPSQMTLDLLLRRDFRLAGRTAGVYIDARNVLNRANVIGVRRDNGQPGISATGAQALAAAAYQADSTPIPYDSPHYNPSADLDHNGRIEGRNELLPLYEAAALDFGAPLVAFGPPRQVRLGLEITL